MKWWLWMSKCGTVKQTAVVLSISSNHCIIVLTITIAPSKQNTTRVATRYNNFCSVASSSGIFLRDGYYWVGFFLTSLIISYHIINEWTMQSAKTLDDDNDDDAEKWRWSQSWTTRTKSSSFFLTSSFWLH